MRVQIKIWSSERVGLPDIQFIAWQDWGQAVTSTASFWAWRLKITVMW